MLFPKPARPEKKKKRPAFNRDEETARRDSTWSAKVLERDGYMCQNPSCRKVATGAHHIVRRAFLSTRWVVDNGVSLCEECHRGVHEHRIPCPRIYPPPEPL